MGSPCGKSLVDALSCEAAAFRYASQPIWNIQERQVRNRPSLKVVILKGLGALLVARRSSTPQEATGRALRGHGQHPSKQLSMHGCIQSPAGAVPLHLAPVCMHHVGKQMPQSCDDCGATGGASLNDNILQKQGGTLVQVRGISQSTLHAHEAECDCCNPGLARTEGAPCSTGLRSVAATVLHRVQTDQDLPGAFDHTIRALYPASSVRVGTLNGRPDVRIGRSATWQLGFIICWVCFLIAVVLSSNIPSSR
jgi:hypothetical protein